MAPPEIFLARHGETDWSKTGRHTGRTDVALTEAGRAQAESLGERLRGLSLSRVLSSPLQRALDTCRIAGLAERAELRPELMEFDYGEYEGLTTPEIRESVPGWTVWTHPIPGGESPAEVGARLDPLVEELAGLETGAAVFAHGHVLRVLAARWLGLQAADGALLALSTATLSTLSWERERRVIKLWNDGSHLTD